MKDTLIHALIFLLIALLLALLAFGVPALAVNLVDIKNTTSFDVTADSGQRFIQIDIDRMHSTGNQAYTLVDPAGNQWYLQVRTTSILNTFWDINLDLTRPDGSIQHQELKPITMGWDYKYTIQYGISQIPNAASISGLDVVFYIGIGKQLNATMGIPVMGVIVPVADASGSPNDFILFDRVTGSSSIPTSWTLYEVTGAEEVAIKENNLLFNAGNVVTSALSWTWDMVLAFIEKIPVIGPYFALILGIVGATLGEIWWWFGYIAANWDIFIVIIECLILGHALMASNERGKQDFLVLFVTVGKDHLLLFKAFLWFIEFSISLIMRFIEIVSAIVQNLKFWS